MKKQSILISLLLLLFGCTTPKVTDVVSYEHNGAWYWILEYQEDATQEDVNMFVDKWAHSKKTSYFYAYPNDLDLTSFKKPNINFIEFTGLIIANKPTYGLYKLPMNNTIFDDGYWLLQVSQDK